MKTRANSPMWYFAALLVYAVCFLVANKGEAQQIGFPSQPTFQKWGVGINPNSAEVVAEWGGATPSGFAVIAQQTNGDGCNLMFLAREAGIDQTTNQFNLGCGANGTNGSWSISAPWGNAVELFSDAGGATGTVSIGAGSSDITEFRSLRQFINNNAPIFDLVELDAAADERTTRYSATAGLVSIGSLTDALGAGENFLTANRLGTAWDAVTLTSSGTTSLISTVANVVLNAGDGAGDRIVLIGNAAESLDVDFQGATVYNSVGQFEIFDTLLMSGVQLNSDGVATAPTISFSQDTNSGFYRIGNDNIGLALSGALSINFANGQLAPNYNGSAGVPAYSWNTDPDAGFYRIGADNIGVTLAGALEYDFSTSVFDLNDNSIDDTTDNNVNISANATIVGDLVVTGTITGGGSGQSFGGFVDAAATSESVPAGWSATVSTATFTVNHTMGTANFAVALTAYQSTTGCSASTDDSKTAALVSKSSTTFVYTTYCSDDTSTTQSAQAADFVVTMF